MKTTEHPALTALRTLARVANAHEAHRETARDAVPALEALLAERDALREALADCLVALVRGRQACSSDVIERANDALLKGES